VWDNLGHGEISRSVRSPPIGCTAEPAIAATATRRTRQVLVI